MITLDLFTLDDEVNIVATLLFRKLQSRHRIPCTDVICGKAHLDNENDHETIYFTMESFKYVRNKLFTIPW